MSEIPWKSGDVVRLKSGGPDITVAGDDEVGQIMCQWFVGINLKEGTFNPEMLENAGGPAGFNKKIEYPPGGQA